MRKRLSIKITPEADDALQWLRQQAGGFNLSQAVSKMLVAECKRRRDENP